MNDKLSQLLRRTDQQTPPPLLNSTSLPMRIRQSAEKQFQRRVLASVFATLPILIPVMLLAVHHLRQPQVRIVQADSPSNDDLTIQIAYHQRVADLLQANHPLPAPNPHATDEFLLHLQLERSQAALLLLNNATDQLRDGHDNSKAADRLHQTIALFPETQAAAIAQRRIQQLENSKRQS